MRYIILCTFVLALPLWVSHEALGAEPTSSPATSPAKPATLEVLRQWRASLKTDGLEKAMEAIASSVVAFPKIHTHAYYERLAAEATPPALESLGLAEDMAAAMPLYRDRLRQRPIEELKGAASTAAQAAEKVLAGGGYGNLVLAIAIVGTVRPVLLERMIADPAAAPAIEPMLRPASRELATPEEFLRLAAEETGRSPNVKDPAVLRGPRPAAIDAVIRSLFGAQGKSIYAAVMGDECDKNPANHLRILDLAPVGFWLLSTQFESDLGEGMFQLVQAEKGWPDTEKGFREAVERNVAAVREKRIKPLSPSGKPYVSQDFVKFFRLTWRSGRAPSSFRYPAGSQGASGGPAALRPSPWPDSQEAPRPPTKPPAPKVPARP